MSSDGRGAINQSGIKFKSNVKGGKFIVTQVAGEESILQIGDVADTETQVAGKEGHVKQTAVQFMGSAQNIDLQTSQSANTANYSVTQN
jgi:hypothetical protein